MMQYMVITGGGSGLGTELTKIFSTCSDLSILSVGRNIDSLKETQAHAPSKIKILVADIGTEDGRNAICAAIPQGVTISHVIHNAAILEPEKITDILLNQFRHVFAVNLEGPIFLTQALLPHMKENSRILHISTGFAHRAAVGLSLYCMSKAALYMGYQCLSLELAERKIFVGSLSPGVIDTNMQANLRATPEQIVPMSPQFWDLKRQNKLRHPSVVAKFIKWVMLDTDHSQFSEKEWSINDIEHQQNWLNS